MGKAKISYFIDIYLLSHEEYGQVLDCFDIKKSFVNLAFTYMRKGSAFTQKFEGGDCSLLEEAKKFGLTLSLLNGRFIFMREVQGPLPDLDLPETVKEHLAKKRPIMISQTY